MSNSRYKLNKPLLALGITLKDKDMVAPPTIASLIIAHSLGGLKLEDVVFHIVDITPIEEHDSLIEYGNGETAKGYVGEGFFDYDELNDFDLVFVNQYPKASYSQTSNDGDYLWHLKELENKKGVVKAINEAHIPFYYQTLSMVLSDLENNKGDECINRIYEALMEVMKIQCSAWEVVISDFNDDPELGVKNVEVKMIDNVSDLTLCDDHHNRLAVKRIVGEVDSFGAEYLHLCPECYENYQREMEEADDITFCEWCKKDKPDVRPYRDPEEGSCGPVYEVCGDCVKKHNEYLNGDDS